ncbi:hypothetical protein PS681_05394 [Pseudomonas fluorescens]|nr:hypothetical protein PS681_05394 [Pseudomonas fluorescens]
MFGNAADGFDDGADHLRLLVQCLDALTGSLHVPRQITHYVDRFSHHRGATLRGAVGLLRGAVGDARRVGDGLFAVDLISDHGGELHHFVQFVVGIDHRVVGRLQPHRTTMAVDTLEAVSDEFAVVQTTPEILVLGAVVFLRGAEQAVMFALDLRQAVTHAAEEAIVGVQHIAVEVELDHRSRTHQRTDQVFVFTRGFNGAGQVAGEQRNVLDPPIRRTHRLHDRTQPRFFTIATQQAHGTGEMLTAIHGVFEAVMEFVRLHVGRDDVFNRPTDQVMTLVEHLGEEVLVDRLNAPVGLKVQHQHLAFQAFLHLHEAGEFFTKSGQLLLQAFVEHGEYRWAGWKAGCSLTIGLENLF